MLQCLVPFSSLSQCRTRAVKVVSAMHCPSLWSAPLFLLQYQSATRQQRNLLLLLAQGGKALAGRCVNTLLVFATAFSAGGSQELQETERNHVFRFLARLFSATEQCKSKNVNASSASVKKQAFGDNEDILFYEREMFQAGYIFLKEYLCCKTKILLNKTSLEIQIKMFCFDTLGTGY